MTYKKFLLLLQPARVVLSPQTLHADRERRDNSKRWESFFDPTYSFSCRGENADFWSLTHWVNLIPSGCHGNLPVITISCCLAWSLLYLFSAPPRSAYSLCASGHRRVLEYLLSYSSSTRVTNYSVSTALLVSHCSCCYPSTAIFLRKAKYEYVQPSCER